MANDPKLSILIPVRNEGMNIKIMLKILSVVVDLAHEIVIVYDNPEDDCVSVVNSMQPEFSHVSCVLNRSGKGIINAIRSGVAVCQGKYILLLAVDDLGPVLAISEMAHLMDQGCDLVSATRYSHGGKRLGGSLIGGILSRVANRLLNFLAGSKLHDATTGIKMFRKDKFYELDLRSGPVGWAVVFEMAVKAQYRGFRLGEVPVVSIDRIYGGESSFSVGPWIREYLRWFFWGLWNLHQQQHAVGEVLRLPKYRR